MRPVPVLGLKPREDLFPSPSEHIHIFKVIAHILEIPWVWRILILGILGISNRGCPCMS
jgi:hypothetical protein